MLKHIKGFSWLVLGTFCVFFYMYIKLLWPPNLIRFLKEPNQEPSKSEDGQGIGPGIYAMIKPIVMISGLMAFLTHIGLICALVFITINITVSFA